MFVHELETPVTIVDLDVLERNVASMAALCRSGGVALRPMVKTHKSPVIAKRQMEYGAVGVLVATLDEAEEMAAAGIADVTVAYPLVNPRQRERLLRLSEQVKLTVSVDSVAAVEAFGAVFGPAARDGRQPVDVLIIIDSGGRRLGVSPDGAVDIARVIAATPGLTLAGVATHPGHVYGCASPDQVAAVAAQETGAVLAAAEQLGAAGFPVDTVAVGSTPTARFSAKTPGITEIRPGNYVFYDAIQVALGSAVLEDCALRVLGTVLSRPTPRTAVIDVGSKMLSSDKGAHGLELVKGYGVVVSHPDVVVERVSEELAVLSMPPDSALQVGDRVEIVPNHACTACNLVDVVVGVRGGVVETIIPVAARRRIRV